MFWKIGIWYIEAIRINNLDNRVKEGKDQWIFTDKRTSNYYFLEFYPLDLSTLFVLHHWENNTYCEYGAWTIGNIHFGWWKNI